MVGKKKNFVCLLLFMYLWINIATHVESFQAGRKTEVQCRGSATPTADVLRRVMVSQTQSFIEDAANVGTECSHSVNSHESGAAGHQNCPIEPHLLRAPAYVTPQQKRWASQSSFLLLVSMLPAFCVLTGDKVFELI